jgi:hypothetical protein
VSKTKEKKRRDADQTRAVVSYFDGTWTDRLSARCLAIDREGDVLRLLLEITQRGKSVAAKGDALKSLVASRGRIDSILLLKPAFRGKLRRRLMGDENRALSVTLRALRVDIEYPASAFFGPDGITLTLG